MKKLLIFPLVAAVVSASGAPKKTPAPSYATVEAATKAHADFPMVGEYVSNDGKTAFQANMLPDGTFLVARYTGGLPGAGWDKSAIDSSIKTTDQLKATVKDFQKVERTSPTLGKPQPADAILKFPADFTNVKDGILLGGGVTKKELSSFRLHLEFMMPFKPGRNLSNQDRGNSGIYIFNNYEVQVMDSFGLDFEHPENNANKIESKNNQWCGSLYKAKLPDVNMTFPPLQWQTYDIDFTAPVFDGKKKIKNARVTVRHNGVLIHDDYELLSGTGNGAKKPQLAEGPLFFQAHGNQVMYRNIWATELK
ncbi:DUF1080 domain-containing protein [Pontiellaceae bacterium B12227]|nr:DUF1080 domain-containing protein [Pontiellaceae bacterium B12227]